MAIFADTENTEQPIWMINDKICKQPIKQLSAYTKFKQHAILSIWIHFLSCTKYVLPLSHRSIYNIHNKNENVHTASPSHLFSSNPQ